MNAVRWPSTSRTGMVAVVAIAPQPATAPPSALRAVVRKQPASPLGYEPSRPMSPQQQGWWRQWRDAVSLVMPLGERRELADAVTATGDSRFADLEQELRTTPEPRIDLGMSAIVELVSVLSDADDAIDDASVYGWNLTSGSETVASVSRDEVLTETDGSRLRCTHADGVVLETSDTTVVVSGWRRDPSGSVLLCADGVFMLPRAMSALLDDAAPGCDHVDVIDAGASLWAPARIARARIASMAARYGGRLTIEPA